ncbi:hypothetical protein SHIRM173S_01809 [Streptomyces hirsutus]
MSFSIFGLASMAMPASQPMPMKAPTLPLAKTSPCCGVASSLSLGALDSAWNFLYVSMAAATFGSSRLETCLSPSFLTSSPPSPMTSPTKWYQFWPGR